MSHNRRNLTIGVMVLAGTLCVLALVLVAQRSDHAVAGTRDPRLPTPEVTRPRPKPPIADVQDPQTAPLVDVVFVLDTTGSMGGLIAGAKQKIWSIANQIMQGQPRPDLRVGLIAYRDVGDEYVTRRFDFSTEMDDVYKNLQSFQAAGGGDTPEHVNRALAEAIRDLKWRKGQRVLRQIYLVGDAPPHEGRDGLYSTTLAREAAQAGIVINSVRCGQMAQTEVAWQRIASLAGGVYASIAQDGNMATIATPMDRRLAELNARLTATLLATGSASDKEAAGGRAIGNASMDAPRQAESAVFRARRGVVDGTDLLAQMGKGRKLSSFKREELPAAVAARPPAEREVYVNKVAAERQRVQQEILKLPKDRDAYLSKAKRDSKRGDGFDDKVGEALKKQGAKAGIKY